MKSGLTEARKEKIAVSIKQEDEDESGKNMAG